MDRLVYLLHELDLYSLCEVEHTIREYTIVRTESHHKGVKSVGAALLEDYFRGALGHIYYTFVNGAQGSEAVNLTLLSFYCTRKIPSLTSSTIGQAFKGIETLEQVKEFFSRKGRALADYMSERAKQL